MVQAGEGGSGHRRLRWSWSPLGPVGGALGAQSYLGARARFLGISGPKGIIDPFERFHPACTIMLLCQRANRKLSYGRGEHSTPLPAGSFCGAGGAALDAAWFAVSVGGSQNAQMAGALAVAPGHRVPVPVRPARDLLALC